MFCFAFRLQLPFRRGRPLQEGVDHIIQLQSVECNATGTNDDFPQIRAEISVEHSSPRAAVRRGILVPDEARQDYDRHAECHA
jgi:hypothetical protein